MLHALIIDEDRVTAGLLSDLAQSESYHVTIIDDLTSMDRRCEAISPDLVFINHESADGRISEWLGRSSLPASADVVLIGEVLTSGEIVQAFRWGIADVLFKPVDTLRVRHLLRHRITRFAGDAARSQRGDFRQAARPPATLKGSPVVQLLGDSSVMKRLRHQIDRVSPTEASVLLLGESGTGKELVAQTIHSQSGRHRQIFLPVNCGAISPQLIESEIFGHEKGSFTGADRQHKGYFERASGGTLFLDEIIEMPIDLQVKLLRVLETGTFMRIGSSQELKTDVRIIAATNRDPDAAITEGRLRLDLYHRLNVFPLKVPPLRERSSDINLMAQHFLDELNILHQTQKYMSVSMQTSLSRYHWPGNVRELRNFVQRAYILSDHTIELHTPDQNVARTTATALTLAIPVGSSLAEVDRKLIFATLELCGGVKKRAADLLGISLKTLYNRLEEYKHPGKSLCLIESGKAANTPNASLRMPGSDSSLLN